MPRSPFKPNSRALGTACLLFFTLGACETVTVPSAVPDGAAPALSQGAAMPIRPVVPTFETRTPTYPAIAVYIVYREWVHRNPGMTTLSLDDPHYQRYVEKRLRELYPDRGYSGMMRDAVAEAQRNRAAWQQYERELREYERQMGVVALSGYSIASTCGTTYVDP